MHGLGRYYELEFVCRGEADSRTGYLINIKDVDRAARSAVIPLIERAVKETPWIEPASLMGELFEAARQAFGSVPHDTNVPLLAPSRGAETAVPGPSGTQTRSTDVNPKMDRHQWHGPETSINLVSLRWNLTPTYSVEMEASSLSRVVMRQRFDFAAAHRLHVPGLTDEQNRATFGRCNNPSGHGHNYRIEPAVAFDAANTTNPFTLADLERLTHLAIIEPFDHTHLNKDTAPFAESGGLNPSVENIARVFHGLLAAAIRRERPDAELVSMTVWETDRTSCTFPG
jgi:6-pyruvoyl-tetrahydropterin synthase